MNRIASDLGDIVCTGIRAFDIGVMSSSCAARSSTITIGYIAMAAMAIIAIGLFIKSRQTA